MNFASDYVYAKKRNAARPPAPPMAGGNSAIASCSLINLELDETENDMDTNVVSAKFDQLVERSNTYTGDFYKCTNCPAILSRTSKVSEPSKLDNKRAWKCEFCSFENRIAIEKEEIPSKEEVTYILEGPSEKMDEATDGETDTKYLGICILIQIILKQNKETCI